MRIRKLWFRSNFLIYLRFYW